MMETCTECGLYTPNVAASGGALRGRRLCDGCISLNRYLFDNDEFIRREKNVMRGNSVYGCDSGKTRVRLVEWAEERGVTLSGVCADWQSILNAAARKRLGLMAYGLPQGSFWDHASLWNRDGKKALVIAQPYMNIESLIGGYSCSLETFKLMEKEGITLKFGWNNWGWYGHNTSLIEMWLPGIEPSGGEHMLSLDGLISKREKLNG